MKIKQKININKNQFIDRQPLKEENIDKIRTFNYFYDESSYVILGELYIKKE